MRQVFSSPRLENVEGVARLLREAGIEVRISNGRSYRSGWSGRRSYREDAGGGPQASVWVIKSEEQPMARALLREAGLLLDTTMPSDSYLPDPALVRSERPGIGAGSRATRIKIGLLVAIALVIALSFMRAPQVLDAELPATAAMPAPVVETVAPATESWRVPVPTALASLLLAREIDAAGGAAACVAVDEADPAPAILESLASSGREILAASACETDARGAHVHVHVQVHDYRTDGSGHGTVRTTRATGDGSPDTRIYQTERSGEAWRAHPVQ